jgi:hypothetical protein
MFRIEDEMHAEPHRDFETRDEAMAELRRLAAIKWDEEPNRAPCTNWRNCGRHYELVHYDVSAEPWRELSREPVLHISAAGVGWLVQG